MHEYVKKKKKIPAGRPLQPSQLQQIPRLLFKT